MSSVNLESWSRDNITSGVENVKFPLRRRFSRDPIKIIQPDILGFFSVNGDNEFCDDLSQLRYLNSTYDTNVPLDLKINGDKIISKKCCTNDVKLNHILKWITYHLQEFGRTQSNFVTFRGVMSSIMYSPYEKFEGWIICASKFKGTIYLCKYSTPEKIKEEESRTKEVRDMGNWGYIFEQLLLSEHPGSPPNTQKPNDQNEEFGCVFQANIGPYKIMCAAEVDGIEIRNSEKMSKAIGNDPDELKRMLKNKDAEFVELKTSADPTGNRKEWSKICRFKSLKWWAQCYLVGINKLVCGYRGRDGIVKRLKNFSVESLPHLGRGSWDQKVCLQHLVDFLKLVEEKVSSGRDEQLWKFTWYPGNADFIQVELCEDNSPFFFLHKWATDKIVSKKRKNEDSSEDTVASCSKK